MDFITEDLAKEANLTPEQVAALNPKFSNYISDQKKEWDGKANENAESILSGAAKYLMEKAGVNEERLQGEKFGDYFNRLSEKALTSKKSEVDKLKSDYEEKLKNFKGDETTKQELQAAKTKLDDALKKYADYDQLKEKADKYEDASKNLSSLKIEVAFSNVKPNFPDSVNSYEAKAKWSEFQKGILEKYNLELVEDEVLAIDKENQYKQLKLSELVAKDTVISALLENKPAGTGAKSSLDIKDLPFKVSEEALKNTSERAKAIKEQLAKEGISETSSEYAARFAEYNKKIMEAKPA
ncbi:hypothetical protein CMT52_18005 [Elizabethkingia anophelis]|nr:hypothetical protein [Elizabethkingia anophelis]